MNIKSRLRSHLDTKALELLEKLALLADTNNQRLFLVGGIVRDLLLGRKSIDLDVVFEGNAIDLAKKFSRNKHLQLIKYDTFGTATLSYCGFNIDIVSARREFYRYPGALPEVFPGNIGDDLFRRDFTINAMAIALNKADLGKFIDPYYGARDIKNKLVRTIHQASFRDDATRIFRALRYVQRLHFKLEPDTERLLLENVKMLSTISPARIKNEMKLIFKEEMPEAIISIAQEFGVLQQIHPSLQAGKWTTNYYNQARLWARNDCLSQIYFNLLVLSLNPQELQELNKRISLTRKEMVNLEQTLYLKSRLSFLANKITKPSHIYNFLKPFNQVAIITNMIASDSPSIKNSLEYYLTKLRFVKPMLTGKQLKVMGISEGPQIGKLIERLLAVKLDGKVSKLSDEIQFVNRLSGIKKPKPRK